MTSLLPNSWLQKEARGETAPAEAQNGSHNPGVSHYLISSNVCFPLSAAPLENMAKYKVPEEFRGAISSSANGASKLTLLRYD